MSQPSTRVQRNGAGLPAQPNPEVEAKAKRRSFRAAYKLAILQEAERCTAPGAIGALLRREGLYASHLTSWRHQREAGELAGLTPKVRGQKPDRQAAELAALRQENERLRVQLEQANVIITAQKKLAQVLEQTLNQGQDKPSCEKQAKR